MARCPFAKWEPITGSTLSYVSGPFKIVHHTTEGGTYVGAKAAFKVNKSDPHFTVDATTIYQHVDTSFAARSLANASGGVQTNRDSAIQIEVVGFAGKAKNVSTLENVARLCRWIESTHSIPQVWPSGPPKPPKNGKDPGGHNRSSTTWNTKAGHYGHCHVPENTHWDPAYTKGDLKIIMGNAFESLELPEEEVFSFEEVSFEESLALPEPIEVELASVKLVTYPVPIELDDQGHGSKYVDVSVNEVISVIPQALNLTNENMWSAYTVALAEDEGRTVLVASGGKPNTSVIVFVKVLQVYGSAYIPSVGCPADSH